MDKVKTTILQGFSSQQGVLTTQIVIFELKSKKVMTTIPYRYDRRQIHVASFLTGQ